MLLFEYNLRHSEKHTYDISACRILIQEPLTPYLRKISLKMHLMLLQIKNIKLFFTNIYGAINAMKSAIFEHEFIIKGTKECMLTLFMTHARYFYKCCGKLL
jgi:hypothetical protein